jgi:hypothetical protein
MSGACDKSLISRCVTLLTFSFELMASVHGELSPFIVQIPVADLKRSLYSQVTLSSENLGILNSVICLWEFHLGRHTGRLR